jgi:glutamine amidotransferase-like uncharacterized protein
MLADDPVVNEWYTYPHKDGVGWVRVLVVNISRREPRRVQFEARLSGWGAFAEIEVFKKLAFLESYEEYQKRPD